MINGDVIAKFVTINGTLFTTKKNNDKWIDILKDVIYNTEPEPAVNGEKVFANGIHINSSLNISGLINNYNVSKFLTVDSDQTIEG